MDERLEHYKQVVGDMYVESLTVVVVAGASAAEVAAVIAEDAGLPAGGPEVEDHERSSYSIVEVPGGVLAMEDTGYADPTREALARLSAGGRSAAVVGSNIQGHDRFGCARDGVLLFDDPEYVFLDRDDLSRVPTELRPLFDLAWVDLDSEDEDDDEAVAFAVGLAMAELVTGVELTAQDLARHHEDQTLQWQPVRTLAYADELAAL
ncbi:hypothetical protein GCM10023339_05160 [Alloalcanivorax gelatiniphagus]